MKHDTESKIPESVAEPLKEAMSRAREEIGERVDSLAKEGEKLRDRALNLAESTVDEARERADEVRGMVDGLKSRATNTLDNLEQMFEERVARALKRMGVPTRDDVRGITKRLEDINDRIKALAIDRTPPVEERDDLKQINGIGPVLEEKLNAAGIARYRQIAELGEPDIDRLESVISHLSGRVRRDDWVGQAKALHRDKYGESI
jgi:poly(hydroxyalkanoate) granule-associated protein